MPGGDRTGPMGMGSMTGRGAGYCAGYGAPGYASGAGWRGGGRGIGWGRGAGRGWGVGWNQGWRGYAYPQPVVSPPAGDETSQLASLQNQAEQLRRTLEQLESHVRTLMEKDAT